MMIGRTGRSATLTDHYSFPAPSSPPRTFLPIPASPPSSSSSIHSGGRELPCSAPPSSCSRRQIHRYIHAERRGRIRDPPRSEFCRFLSPPDSGTCCPDRSKSGRSTTSQLLASYPGFKKGNQEGNTKKGFIWELIGIDTDTHIVTSQ